METSSVEIIRENRKFTVRVTENGEVREQVFMNEGFAQSWAAGQRVRLAQKEAAEENNKPDLQLDNPALMPTAPRSTTA